MTRSESSDSGDGTPPTEFRDVVREEARYVVTAQIEALRDTDDKALATARINGIVLGLLVSTASISNDPTAVLNRWMITGSSILLGSLCIAVLTYTVDRPSYGIGPGYVDANLKTFDSTTTAERDLLQRYAEWIDDNSAEIRTNGNYLLATQFSFVLGLLIIGVGIYDLL